MTEATPRPCPLCDGEACVLWFALEFNIHCPECGLSISRHGVDMPGGNAVATKAACIAAWNTRAVNSHDDLVSALVALLWRIDEHFGNRPEWDWKEQEDARAAIALATEPAP